MAILRLPMAAFGEEGTSPLNKKMVVTDDLTTLTAAGYLNARNLQGFSVSETDLIQVTYNADPITLVGDYIICNVSISSGVITLVEATTTNEVTYTPPSIPNHFAVYSNTTGNLTKDVTTAINGGSIQAGLSGTAGILSSFPSAASSGKLIVSASANSANVDVTLTNASVGSARNYTLIDSGTTNGFVQISAAPSSPCSNLIWVDALITFTQINANYTFFASPGASARFRIREIYLNTTASPLAGGNRDIQITDSTTIYSKIPSASALSPTNDRWGSTAVPYPAAAAINLPTAAGFPILVNYGSGSTAYTSGNISLSILLERVA